jgi:hypothetical protein
MKITKLHDIDIEDFEIQVSKSKKGSKCILIEFSSNEFWDVLIEKYGSAICCSYTTKSKSYSNLKDGQVDISTLTDTQVLNLKQSIFQKLRYNIAQQNKEKEKSMRENIKASAVENAKYSSVNSKPIFNLDELITEDKKDTDFGDFDFDDDDFDFTELETVSMEDNEIDNKINDLRKELTSADREIKNDIEKIKELTAEWLKLEKNLVELRGTIEDFKRIFNDDVLHHADLQSRIVELETKRKK